MHMVFIMFNIYNSKYIIIASMNINTTELLTIHNYARIYKSKRGGIGVTPAYIYMLINKGKITPIEIDGVLFIKK